MQWTCWDLLGGDSNIAMIGRTVRDAGRTLFIALLALGILTHVRIVGGGEPLRGVTLALTPSRDPTVLQEVGGELATHLGRHLGMPVKVHVASDYAGVIEALRSQLVDVAFLTAVGYVLAAREAGAEIVVKATRGGRADYAARIFVLRESPITQLADLRGKTIAFVDPASSSGYIYPMVLLVKEGLVRDRDPKTFLKESIFAGGHDAALLGVLHGSVDAAAAFDEAPERILKDPAKAARFRYIAETPRIPNDGAAVRRGLSSDAKARLTSALLALNVPAGIDLLRRLYNIDGLVSADDRDYDPVREAVDLLGVK
jgi:phosphonate transport system substrate-binding protein